MGMEGGMIISLDLDYHSFLLRMLAGVWCCIAKKNLMFELKRV